MSYLTAIELLLFAFALSMDAFAVAVCIGLTKPLFRLKDALIVGLYFGVFQAMMPLIGFFVGGIFAQRVAAVDHWLAFALLMVLGLKMIWGSFKRDEESGKEASLAFLAMLPLAFATSVDALAAGVSFAFLRVDIVPAVVLIGVVTFAMSAMGVKIGGIVGVRFKSKAEFLGGVILVVLAVRALVEGL